MILIVIAILLAAILITLLGAWGVVGTGVGLIILLCVVIGVPVSLLGAVREWVEAQPNVAAALHGIMRGVGRCIVWGWLLTCLLLALIFVAGGAAILLRGAGAYEVGMAGFALSVALAWWAWYLRRRLRDPSF